MIRIIGLALAISLIVAGCTTHQWTAPSKEQEIAALAIAEIEKSSELRMNCRKFMESGKAFDTSSFTFVEGNIEQDAKQLYEMKTPDGCDAAQVEFITKKYPDISEVQKVLGVAKSKTVVKVNGGGADYEITWHNYGRLNFGTMYNRVSRVMFILKGEPVYKEE